MDKNKSTKYTLPTKALSARPCNFQTIHDARKKCQGNFRVGSNLSIQARQMTDDFREWVIEELDNIPALNPDDRKRLIGDVDKYVQSLFKMLMDGKGKEHLNFDERERLTSEYTSLIDRVRALHQPTTAVNLDKLETAKKIAEAYGLDVNRVRVALYKATKKDFNLRTEIKEPKAREPKYLYDTKRAKPYMDELKSNCKPS